jgi:hypothetical protein
MNALDELETQILATLHITVQSNSHRYKLMRITQSGTRAQ